MLALSLRGAAPGHVRTLARHHCGPRLDGGGLRGDLMAPDRLEPDRARHEDAVDPQRIAGFQWIASRMPRAAEGVTASSA